MTTSDVYPEAEKAQLQVRFKDGTVMSFDCDPSEAQRIQICFNEVLAQVMELKHFPGAGSYSPRRFSVTMTATQMTVTDRR